MNKLSENFWLSEFTRSQTATRRGIENNPGSTEVYNLRQLCQNLLQPLRQAMGFSLHISSGYRSPLLNAAIGGSTTSQHSKGEAADIDHPTKNKDIFDYIKKNLDYDQLIWEFGTKESPAWVHVSFCSENRKETLMAYKEENKTRYKTI